MACYLFTVKCKNQKEMDSCLDIAYKRGYKKMGGATVFDDGRVHQPIIKEVDDE